MHLTTSTLRCLCISKNPMGIYGQSSSCKCFISLQLLPRWGPGTAWYLRLTASRPFSGLFETLGSWRYHMILMWGALCSSWTCEESHRATRFPWPSMFCMFSKIPRRAGNLGVFVPPSSAAPLGYFIRCCGSQWILRTGFKVGRSTSRGTVGKTPSNLPGRLTFYFLLQSVVRMNTCTTWPCSCTGKEKGQVGALVCPASSDSLLHLALQASGQLHWYPEVTTPSQARLPLVVAVAALVDDFALCLVEVSPNKQSSTHRPWNTFSLLHQIWRAWSPRKAAELAMELGGFSGKAEIISRHRKHGNEDIIIIISYIYMTYINYFIVILSSLLNRWSATYGRFPFQHHLGASAFAWIAAAARRSSSCEPKFGVFREWLVQKTCKPPIESANATNCMICQAYKVTPSVAK